MSAEYNEAEERAEFQAHIAAAKPDDMYWVLYRLLQAIYSARAERWERLSEGERKGLYHIVNVTADYWAPLIPGMLNAKDVAAEIAADDAYHETTYRAEARGERVTGDEFI